MSYEAQVLDALGAAGVRPPGTLLWFGRRVDAARLVDALRQRLLADFYEPGAARPRSAAVAGGPGDGGELARALSQANCGRGSWQAGWRVVDAGGDTVTVVRPDGLRLLAPAEDCRGDEVRVPKECKAYSPGCYVALGDAPPAGGERVRLSWNIAATGAVALVARITYVLNGAGLPFSLELPDGPGRYERRDAAALLLARTDFAAAIKLLRPLLRALGPHLADGAPAFAKPLARGLAVAEEPAGDEGFGEHRCRLLAEAILTAGERGLRSSAERLAVVRERFAAAGIALDAPYLQPGSDDAYELS
jgi:hypothetical protein